MTSEMPESRLEIPRDGRPVIVRLLFAAILGMATLVLCEIALRVYQWVQSDSRTIVSSDVLHHRLRPGLDAVDPRGDRPHRLVTNSMGFVEDREIDLAKPPGVYRIFYVGDSNVQGLVDFPDKMVRRVESDLNARRPPGIERFEVVNAGTSSYSPYLYYVLIKRVLLAYRPDLIVVNVDMTDVANDDLYRRFAVFAADGTLDSVVDAVETSRYDYAMTPNGLIRVERPSRLYRWFAEHTSLFYYVDKILTRQRVRRAIGNADTEVNRDADWLAFQWNKEIEASIVRTMEMLGATAKLVRANGIKLAITGVPHLPQYDGRWSSRPHEALGAFAASLDIPYFDGFAAIAARAPASGLKDLYFATDDTHFNAAGNRVWADAQIEFLRDPRWSLIPR
jgi:hypothetical protein